MAIDKRPNGNYRIRKTYKGVNYSLTVDFKPTKREAEELMNEYISKNSFITTDSKFKSFENALDQYIEIKRNVLSPSTLRGYKSIKNALPDWFMKKKLSDIDSQAVQKLVNDYSVDRKPKTVKNMYGLVCPVLQSFNENIKLKVTLPQPETKISYFPTDDDIQRIMEYVKGSKYESAFILASLGLRRSEIVAVDASCLEGNVLTIHKALVLGDEHKFVEKTTKTVESTRSIVIPENTAARLKEIGFYEGYPSSIYWHLCAVQKALDIPHFTLHTFRHYFATKMSEVLPEADVLALGGWSKTNNTVMKSVYRHSQIQRDQKMQKKATAAMSKYLKY